MYRNPDLITRIRDDQEREIRATRPTPLDC